MAAAALILVLTAVHCIGVRWSGGVQTKLATLVLAPLTVDEPYDFARSTLPGELAARAGEIQDFREFWEVPPVDVAYIHRKIGGLFMLATRLRVQVNAHELLVPWLSD